MGLSESKTTELSQQEQEVSAKACALTMLGLAVSVGTSAVLAPASAAAVSAPAAETQSATVTHFVREGETLWSLSKRYGVTPDIIARDNGVEADNLRVGQRLHIVTTTPANFAGVTRTIVPVSLGQATNSAANVSAVPRNLAQLQLQQAAAPTPVTASTTAIAFNPHQVKGNLSASAPAKTVVPGTEFKLAPLDTVGGDPSQISTEGVPFAQMPSQSDSTSVKPDGEAEASSTDQSAEYSVATSSLSPLQRDAGTAELTTYAIRVGDTVSSIAAAHGISTAALIELNNIRNPNRVFAGQVLKVPVPVAPAPAVADIITEPSQPVQIAAALPTSLPAPTQELRADEDSGPQVSEIVESAVEDAVVEETAAEDAVAEDTIAEGTVDESAVDEDTVAELPEVEDDSLAVESDISEPSAIQPDAVGQNAYAEALQNDIATMEADVADVGESEAVAAAESDVELIAAAPDVEVTPEIRDDAINPEFEASSTEATAADAAQQSETVVATAALGSENYRNLVEPVTGRMVSPELPPLSDDPADHLPSATTPMDGYLWPARGILTSGYGWRWGRMHQGIDVAAPVGTPIVAAAPGVVEFSGWNSGGYGNMVDIRHPDGNKTRYAHNSRNLVRVGQKVEQGQQIATMGSTGFSTGPHVHFEIHVPRQGAINPIAMLPDR